MVNVVISLYPKNGETVLRQMNLTEDGYVELNRLGEEERRTLVCGLVRFDPQTIERVELKETAES